MSRPSRPPLHRRTLPRAERHPTAVASASLASLIACLFVPLATSAQPAAPSQPPPAPSAGALLFHEGSRLPLAPGYRLLYEQLFDDPAALRDFTATDPAAWRLGPGRSSQALELTRQSRYQPPVRSPVNITLLSNRTFGDFILEADLVQTGREYGHRDMCLFFGYQNPTNFYYVHLATAADDHAHNVFLVKNAPRTKIARQTTPGVNWGLEVWHRVRLERRVVDGSIRVFFDRMDQPIMVAEDRSFGEGHLGFGSFDDTGRIDNIRVWGPSAGTRPLPPFPTSTP